MELDRKTTVQQRMLKIEGQLKGVQRMVAEERLCIDVLRQISSVQQALNGVARVVMEGHLQNCVKKAMRSADEETQDQMINEVLETLFAIKKR
ncbi:MAG: metal-sensitive transcriptional regulator [Candidatus Schekmanbacteria bacterium]|nr:metal-sensitive transcriptional regulator [Candidatus Schekmanbacteria bacterium]